MNVTAAQKENPWNRHMNGMWCRSVTGAQELSTEAKARIIGLYLQAIDRDMPANHQKIFLARAYKVREIFLRDLARYQVFGDLGYGG